MKTFPTCLIQRKNVLASSGSWLWVIEIALNDVDETILRYVADQKDFVWQGQKYLKANFYFDDEQQEIGGGSPSRTLSFSNIRRTLQPYLEELDGAADATIIATLVNTECPTTNYAELTLEYDVLSAKPSVNWVTLELGAPNLLRQVWPSEKYMARVGRRRFGDCLCGYTITGSETCNRTLARCRELGNDTRYCGFVGLRPGGARIVAR